MLRNLFSTGINLFFVFIQFGGIGIILFTGPFFSSNIILFAIQAVGIIIGIWSVWIMELDNLSILPKLKENARFVEKGPYKLIRHPMYLAIILVICPLTITKYSVFRIIICIMIIVDLILKLNYEETLLRKRFASYPKYSKKTYRLIPFLY